MKYINKNLAHRKQMNQMGKCIQNNQHKKKPKWKQNKTKIMRLIRGIPKVEGYQIVGK